MKRNHLWVTTCAGSIVIIGSLLLWQRTVASATARPTASASVAAALAVDVHEVTPEALEVLVPASGTLLARESVELVSELQRRLVKVRQREGSRVKRGEVLFELDVGDLKIGLRKAKAQERLARSTLTRTKRLQSDGISNRQELELAQERVDELIAERKMLEMTISKAQIRAPFSGTIGLRRVSQGAWVSPSTVLTVLHDTSSLKLDFTLPERYAGAVGRGDTFRFRVEGNANSFEGEISAIEPSIDTVTRSVQVRAVVKANPALVAGASTSIEVPIRVEQALLVPAIAVIPGVEGNKLFLARDGVARSASVEVGFRGPDRVQIMAGINPGDQVVVSNLLRMRDGAAVQVRSEMGPP